MYKAIIIGAGRIGAGYGKWDFPYVYTHADAYLTLKDRVSLLGFVDSDTERAKAASDKYRIGYWTDVEEALRVAEPDIVSICTPPEPVQRTHLIYLCSEAGVNGIWCEKPFEFAIPSPEAARRIDRIWPFIQVNYIRRADERHRELAEHPTNSRELWVWAKKDIHTVCHFTDLARFWRIPKGQLKYFPMDGPCSYAALCCPEDECPEFFGLGGMKGGFMEAMLGNLLDAIEGKAELISPPESAIESERWANEILQSGETNASQ